MKLQIETKKQNRLFIKLGWTKMKIWQYKESKQFTSIKAYMMYSGTDNVHMHDRNHIWHN